jgi:hypothetical protein
MKTMKNITQAIFTLFLAIPIFANAQTVERAVPAVYTNIQYDDKGLYLDVDGKKVREVTATADYQLNRFKNVATGTAVGLDFDFGTGFKGKIYYGFIPYADSKFPQPVYYGAPAIIVDGKVSIDIKNKLAGKYDPIGWMQSGKGTIGYRVMNNYGLMIYDGRVAFKGKGPFKVDVTVVEGPMVNKVTESSVTISFETSTEIAGSVKVGDRVVKEEGATRYHEITIDGLDADIDYDYTISYAENEQSYAFKTAPAPGTRSKFTFAYASDSRGGSGGGERDIFGANHYMMQKIMALSRYRNCAFAQFSGDLIDGYLYDIGETNLQYANWKHSIDAYAAYFPVYVSMGNHEALGRLFKDSTMRYGYMVDRFPFATESAEAIFGNNFVLPQNGPASEDGSAYDPDKSAVNFPSYDENVYYYTHDNVAVIVLNSNYFYAPGSNPKNTSGCLHGYIMDNQLSWLDETVANLEKDKNIDHVFVTQHTPFFPNGGHVQDDMWYSGNNEHRAWVAGKAVEKGIIERRDELLNIIVNKSTKVRAILSGDEHNYAKTEIGPETTIYPDSWELEKLKLDRTIYQINNGAAGAPYYAQEATPWGKNGSEHVTGFTTQNAVVFFHIDGKKVTMEVMNPDTLEEVDTLDFK